MRNRSVAGRVAGGIILQLITGVMAYAAEVQVLSAVGMRQVLLELGPDFERATGHTLTTTFDAFEFIMKRVEGGVVVDVVIIPRAGVEQPTKAGKVVAGSATEIASSIAGVAVRSGATKPDISSAEADSAAGRFDALAEEALAEDRGGRTREI